MKNSLWALVLVWVGCRKEPRLSVQPSQLTGTWNSPSTLPSGREKPFLRWTFEPDYVYTLEDTLKTCQPFQSGAYYKYWIEEDVLVMHYAGITNGLFPIPDIRRPILSVTASEVVLDAPRQLLERCP